MGKTQVPRQPPTPNAPKTPQVGDLSLPNRPPTRSVMGASTLPEATPYDRPLEPTFLPKLHVQFADFLQTLYIERQRLLTYGT